MTKMACPVLVGVTWSLLKSTTSLPIEAPCKVPASKPTIRAKPYPLCPPIGSKKPSSARLGSVRGRPWRSIIQPSGMVSPRLALALTLPYAATVVAISSTTAGSLPAGIPAAIGLVDNNISIPPQGGKWLALPTAKYKPIMSCAMGMRA